MPAVHLINNIPTNSQPSQNLIPSLLQTPAGLAIIEIQGTIHLPSSDDHSDIEVGRLEFPLYDRAAHSDKEGPWMKKAHLYIGKHQVLNGEVKKLSKPLAVISKTLDNEFENPDTPPENDLQCDQLNILSVIYYKIIFSSRPEPVGQPQTLTMPPAAT